MEPSIYFEQTILRVYIFWKEVGLLLHKFKYQPTPFFINSTREETGKLYKTTGYIYNQES